MSDSWTQVRSLLDRLSPLVGKDRYLVVDKVTSDRSLGFGGGTTVTVAITVHGPKKTDELYIWAKRASYELAVEAVEAALQ